MTVFARAYLDTNVILAVAYREPLDKEIGLLVTTGVFRSTKRKVVVVAPVVAELAARAQSDDLDASFERRRVAETAKAVAQSIARDLKSRPTKVGVNELSAVAAGLEKLDVMFATVADRRYKQLEKVCKQLARHGSTPAVDFDRLTTAFQSLSAAKQAVIHGSVRIKDHFVVEAIRQELLNAPGVFLTLDNPLRKYAQSLGIDAPHVDDFLARYV